jgi:hypothetical protein
MYWLKVFYGLVSFPFAFFTLPMEGKMLLKLITPAQATAYDAHGDLRVKSIEPPNRYMRFAITHYTTTTHHNKPHSTHLATTHNPHHLHPTPTTPQQVHALRNQLDGRSGPAVSDICGS